MENDQIFIEKIVKHLVNNPKDVTTERIVDERGVLITLKVNQEDLGGLIGKQGRTINELRLLARVWGMKNKEFLNLRLDDGKEK
jgi:uncharacterized protein